MLISPIAFLCLARALNPETLLENLKPPFGLWAAFYSPERRTPDKVREEMASVNFTISQFAGMSIRQQRAWLRRYVEVCRLHGDPTMGKFDLAKLKLFRIAAGKKEVDSMGLPDLQFIIKSPSGIALDIAHSNNLFYGPDMLIPTQDECNKQLKWISEGRYDLLVGKGRARTF